MKKCISSLMLILILVSCSNSTDMETGEIKVLQMLKQAFEQQSRSKIYVDSRNLLSREQIDAAKGTFEGYEGHLDEADQKAELEQIEHRFAARKAELEQKLRAANLALAGAMEADKSYSPAVQAAIDDFHTAMGELQKVTIEHVFEMREILTEEQAIVFDAEVVRALTEL